MLSRARLNYSKAKLSLPSQASQNHDDTLHYHTRTWSGNKSILTFSCNMASHSLALAKASLAAGMMRPDPISIPRAETARFHDSLEALLKQCSAFNVQV